MSAGAVDLGEIQELGKALGLLDSSDGFRSDWLTQPGHYLSTVLADDTQRNALIQFVDNVLGGEERETDPDGLIWLPVASNPSPHVTVYVVLDATPSDSIGIGLGARLTTIAPNESKTSVHVPVFRAAKSGHTVADAILIGHSPSAVIRLETEISLGQAPPLGGIGISVRIPTQAGPAPQFEISLKRLQLPGAAQPRDIQLSIGNLAELESSALELVLGLARAQADAAGVPQLSAIVGLLGLSSSAAIPSLPLDTLASQGVQALATWFESVMSSAAARAAWLGNLATLLGGAVAADQITFAVGPAQVAFSVKVRNGTGGHPVVTPTLAASITQGDVRARFEADLLDLDLASRTARALPNLALFAQFGKRSDGGTRLLSGDPQVDAVRVGVTLDATRRPNFLLAADGVIIAGHPYATLDLSSPDAIAEVAGTVLGNVVTQLLAPLGPVGTAIGLLIGVTPPPSAPGATTLNLATFLHDPVAAIRDYWRGLLHSQPVALTDLLSTLRDLLADATQGGVAITGTGTEIDPWRMPIAGPASLDVWATNGGDVLEVALSAQFSSDNLGQQCTRVSSRIAIGIAHLDLAAGSASFLTSMDASLTVQALNRAQALMSLGPLSLTADFIGLGVNWRPSAGLSVAILAPNLAGRVNGTSVPLALPVLGADGLLALDAPGWDLLERFIGLLASAAPVPWVGQLAAALGWLPAGAGTRPHLRLADVAANSATAIKSWLIAIAVDDAGRITDALQALARMVTGSVDSFGTFAGRGKFEDPYRLPLLPVNGSPELAVWLLPDGPNQPVTLAPAGLRAWRPGDDGFLPADLAAALDAEAAAAPDVHDLVSGRPDLGSGFDLLVTRWTGSDGRIVPPSSDPTGIVTHRLPNATVDQLANAADLTELLGAAPATVIRISVLPASATLPTTPAGHVIDLRGPGLAPETFAQPVAATGQWFVALAERPDARLAAGDTDGIAGQAARLTRVLSPFTSLAGNVALVADSASGHAAIAAANSLAFVDAVVTLGTAFTPVAFTVLDDEPAADAFRLLRALLPPLDPNETDDPDLQLGRGLVNALADLLPLGDPGRELRPPAVPVVPRAGLAVHAMFGVAEADAVLRAITAIIAAGLSGRAMSRAAISHVPPTGARCGLRIPIAQGTTGVTVSGYGLVELFGADVGAGGPVVGTARVLDLHLEVRREGGWLAGGPGVGLGTGPRPPQEVRWVEANLRIPFGDAAGASAEIVLHEPHIFGINRERWIVRPDAAPGSGTDVVTPALPEVRVLISLITEQISDAAGSAPEVDALLNLLRGISMLDASNGSVPDAVDHLLHDPAAHIGAALDATASRAQISAALTSLLTAVPGLTVDLTNRRLVLDTSGTPGARGMLPWTAHLEATAAGTVSALVTLGSPGTTAAGGAVLRVAAVPLQAALEWHRPGIVTPELIPLWPAPDARGIGRALARLIPAECIRMGLEYLRSLDDTAKPLMDAALDAVGLLGPAHSERSVLLPAGLLHDPVSWLKHESSFGGPGGFNAVKVVALIDSLKPIIGVSGNTGEWNLAPGVTALVQSASGNLRLGMRLDTSGFAPIPTAAGRLVATGTFTITLPPAVAPQPGVLLSIGLAGATPGRQAVFIEIAPALSVYVRPATGADIPLYPNPPGLGQLASSAVTHALPFVLDHLAALSGATLQGRVGEVVRAIGDGLNLRTGAPKTFDATRLQAWAADPVGSLVAALPTLTNTALQAISTALAPVLPTGVTATVAAGKLTVTAGTLQVAWQPSPLQFTVAGTITGVPGINSTAIGITLDTSGLKSASVQAGPASIDAGGVTLRPFVSAVVGESPAGGRRIQVGLGLDNAGTKSVAARWNLDGHSFGLVSVNGAVESTDLEHVALGLLESVLDLVAAFAIKTTALQHLLNNHVGATTVREVLRGVVLQDVASPAQLDANLFDAAHLLGRVQRLAVNLAGANPSINIGGGLTIGLNKSGSIIQLVLGVSGRIPLTTGDVEVSVEADSRWIQGQPPAGIAVGVLDSATMTFKPSLAANGIGIRIGKNSGPLLNIGVSLGSVAVHLYGEVSSTGTLSGGVQLQLSDLAVAPSNAQGGNSVAKGIMADGGNGQNQLRPAFSPALAVQKHGGGPVLVSLRAGDGDGPWWLVIQKGFGPIYIEQVGFGVTVQQNQIQKISLLLDGRVSLFGLTAAVDDLQITFVVASDASLFDPSRYAIDLGGLAINADIAGVSLSGGLRKFGDGDNVEYVGMLLGRFAVYGLSVYGGYGSGVVNGQRFASFFAFGAVNGPIGGPPAFFITGIGGGLGINRDLIFPTDLSRFGEFPFIKALDPGAQPSSDPMAEITRLRDFFPIKRGEFWFAAGISFNSFALVDGVAVVSVKIGDGLEIALLGLARMALPRPQFALVSIELGLLCRFSTKEGVLWIQAQLTDNSWLLYEDVRLTGGFAFVTWYKGPNAGQFVLTIGGYHPHFHHDLYPVVPRLGFHWNVSDAIVIKGESYFALTSEAVMAGGKLQASAHFGPAWAEIKFGADGIIYFDPFRYEVSAYASISAGVTIDVWIGEITISVTLGASIELAGPKFHGVAEFDVGPITITVPFGDSSQSQKVYLPWDQFVRKYLEESAPGVARVLSAIPGKGALPPGTGPGGATDTGTADGSAEKPFAVLSEFELTVTTLVPTQKVKIAASETSHPPSSKIGVAPAGISDGNTRLVLSLFDAGNVDRLGALTPDISLGGRFPVGVWGPPQPDDDRKVPAGDVIQAVDGVRFEAVALLQGTLPGQVKYNQVFAPGPRKPLPFINIQQNRAPYLAAANDVSKILPPGVGAAAAFAAAKPWLAKGGHSGTAVAAIERERSAPPRLGSLTQDLATAEIATPKVKLPDPPVVPPIDYVIHPPRAIAVLTLPVLPERAQAQTTVKDKTAVRVAAPTIAGVQAQLAPAVAARLVIVPAAASAQQTTVVPTGATPFTRVARGSVAAVAARGTSFDARARLNSITAGLASVPIGVARAAVPDPSAQQLRAGEVVILQMPNAIRDVDSAAPRPRLIVSGPSRVVAFSHGGDVLLDVPGSANGTSIPFGTERVAVLASGSAGTSGLMGWHSGQDVVYAGWSSALVSGAVMRAEGASVRSTRQRFRAGWMQAAELVTGTNVVVTRFTQPFRTLAIFIDDPVASDTARGLSLVLDGADRRVGADKQPVPPTVVVAGNRSVLIYPIIPSGSAAGAAPGPITVSVASQEGWHLSGVMAGDDTPAAMAGDDTPAAMADRITRNGRDALVAPLVSSHGGSVQLQWAAPTSPTTGTKPTTGGTLETRPVKKAAKKAAAAPQKRKP